MSLMCDFLPKTKAEAACSVFWVVMLKYQVSQQKTDLIPQATSPQSAIKDNRARLEEMGSFLALPGY